MCLRKGQNDNFAMIKYQIQLINHLPPITTLFSMLIEHERKNGLIHVQEESSSLINLVESKKPPGRGKGN